MSGNWLGVIIGILIVGTCMCLAWSADVILGTNYLAVIRETEKRLNGGGMHELP